MLRSNTKYCLIWPDAHPDRIAGWKVDTSIPRNWTVTGKVVDTPKVLWCSIGGKGFWDKAYAQMGMPWDTGIDIDKGDRVLYSWTAHWNDWDVGGLLYMPYDMIFAYEFMGSWQPVNGWMFVDEVSRDGQLGEGRVFAAADPIVEYRDYPRTDDDRLGEGDYVYYRGGTLLDVPERTGNLRKVQRKDVYAFRSEG